MTSKTEFWLDRTVDEIIEGKGKDHVINGGWSVGGTVHVGNLRADGVIIQTLSDLLREKGCKTKLLIMIYDRDPFKAKPGQLVWFENKELGEPRIGAPNYAPSEDLMRKYEGVRYVDVPDPFGCHKDWSTHWLDDVMKTFSDFGLNLKPLRTSEFYGMKETKKSIMTLIKKRGKVIEVMNKYRKRKPFPKDWIPFNGWCPKCHNIADNESLEVNYDEWEIKIRCSKCGWEGWSPLGEGKLQWKLEWATIWHTLGVTVEPYGKDHAVVGGSRDNCQELQRTVFGTEPPFGFMCEWIGKIWKGKDLGDMTGSGNVNWSTSQFLEVAEPEVLRYLYIGHDPRRRFAWDFENVDKNHNDYDKAERIYYGVEKLPLEKDVRNITRAFELSQVKVIPKKMPFQLSYTFAAQLTQILPERKKLDGTIKILKRIGKLDHEPTNLERERIERRLRIAGNWARKYAPDQYKITILKDVPSEILSKLSEGQKKALKGLSEFFIEKRNDNEIWTEIRKMAKKFGIKPSEVFKAAYLVLLGKARGPRLIPLIQSLEREFVVKRFSLRG